MHKNMLFCVERKVNAYANIKAYFFVKEEEDEDISRLAVHTYFGMHT